MPDAAHPPKPYHPAMPRSLPFALAVVLVLTAVTGSWLVVRSPDVPAPPALEESGRVDPLIAEQVMRTRAEVLADPRSAERRGRLAMVYHANGLVHLAAPCYRQAIALDSSNARWCYRLALATADLGEIEAAISAMEEAIERQGDYAPAHWRRGDWLLRLGRAEEAESSFRRATQVNPDDAAAWTGLARALLARGAYAEAARLLEDNVLARMPTFGYARRLLATAYQHLGRTEEARLELARSRGSRPLKQDPWEDEIESFATGYGPIIQRAGKLIEREQPGQALELLAQLRSAHGTDPVLLNTFAEAHFAMGQPSRALEDLRIAARGNPKHFPTRINLSFAHEQLNQAPLALKYADEAIALNPKSGAAYLQKARLLANAENYEAALEPLQLAVRYGAVDPEIWSFMGFMQAKLNRWQDAAESFASVIHMDPINEEVLVALAWSRGEIDEFDAAWAALQKAAKLNPQNPKVREMAERLRRLQQSRPTSP